MQKKHTTIDAVKITTTVSCNMQQHNSTCI